MVMFGVMEGNMKTRNVVAVLGTTGVGKSALAVALARSLAREGSSGRGTDSLNDDDLDAPHSDFQQATTEPHHASPHERTPIPWQGVVLSADSMQLYDGLEVITNKVTVEEMGGVEHWGVGAANVGSSEGSDGVSREAVGEGRSDVSRDMTDERRIHNTVQRGAIHRSSTSSSSDDDDDARHFTGVPIGQGSWEVGRWCTEAWRKVRLSVSFRFV